MGKGAFITFEGIDGCGKSTQIKLLKRTLKKKGFSVIATREPGGTPVAEKLRELILSTDNGSIAKKAELLMYLAARADHVNQVIKPAIKRKEIVLCDRFSDSTVAYQGAGRNILNKSLASINRFATDNLSADLTILIDISAMDAFKRLIASGKKMDRMEREGVAFQERVRNEFLKSAKLNPRRIKIVDGTLKKEEQADIIEEYAYKILLLNSARSRKML